ncbi:MAG: hypothetical protein HQK50_15540 [Oligoflexia bacterium]|nr:hypothetical protein [Oligoflexia bacterium]MBF0366988.1 hypothetical protein [Oligoflexia bacterium]
MFKRLILIIALIFCAISFVPTSSFATAEAESCSPSVVEKIKGQLVSILEDPIRRATKREGHITITSVALRGDVQAGPDYMHGALALRGAYSMKKCQFSSAATMELHPMAISLRADVLDVAKLIWKHGHNYQALLQSFVEDDESYKVEASSKQAITIPGVGEGSLMMTITPNLNVRSYIGVNVTIIPGVLSCDLGLEVKVEFKATEEEQGVGQEQEQELSSGDTTKSVHKKRKHHRKKRH